MRTTRFSASPAVKTGPSFRESGYVPAGKVKVLAIRMIPVLQILNCLSIYLRGWHDPQYEPRLPLAVDHIHKINRLDGQQGLAPAVGIFTQKRATAASTHFCGDVTGGIRAFSQAFEGKSISRSGFSSSFLRHSPDVQGIPDLT